jgi:hypothetical protein
MAKNDDAGSMSDESKGYLEDVKKGKPRKFAMICKGTSVVSLVVYKKGGVEKRKKEAKESGKGQFYFGTVSGKGIDIRFVLARSDGFDSAPVKTTILKSYLADEADIKCKPIFEIVDEPELVLDEDDPLVARFTQLQSAALAACEQHPDRAAEINALCLEIGVHLGQEQADEATAKLQQLEALLSELGSRSTESSSVPPPPTSATVPPPSQPPATDSDALRDKLQQALNKMVPQLKQAVANFPDRKVELLTPVAQIKQHLEAGRYEEAKQGLLSVNALLKQVLQQAAGATPAATETNDASAQYQTKLQQLQPRYELAMQNNAGDTGKFRAVMAYITEQAEAGVFANAIKAIERLAPAIEQALAGSSAWEALLRDLTPQLKQVLTEKKGDVKAISDLFKQAKALQPTDAAQAVELLKQCAALVAAALAPTGQGQTSGGSEEERQSWLELSSEFPGQRSRVATALPDQLAEFERLVQQATGLAEQGQYQQAIQIALQIAELDSAARKAASSSDVQATIPEHIVEDRKKFLLSRWQAAVQSAHVEIQKLISPIADQVPDENPQELIAAITEHLDEFVDDLNNAILGAQSASSSDIRPLDQAMQAIQSYRQRIASDEVLALLDQAKSSLGTDVKVSQQLLTAIDELESRLAG